MSLSGSLRRETEDEPSAAEQTTEFAATSVEPVREGPSERTRRLYVVVLGALLVLLAFGVRLALFRYQTADYTAFYRRWYDTPVEPATLYNPRRPPV